MERLNGNNCLWWEPPNESLPIEFCENTALHGLRYIGQAKRSMFERIFWLIAFIIGVIVASILITGVWRKYNDAPVIITFEDKGATVSQIPFPAVTLCNVNNIQRDKALEILRNGYTGTVEALEQVSLLHHICSASEVRFSQKFGYNPNGSTVPEELLSKIDELKRNSGNDFECSNSTIKDFLEKNAQSCEDMILLCRWADTIQNCSEIFNSIVTDFGKCCTFNFIPPSLLHRYHSEVQQDQHTESYVLDWARSKLSSDELWIDSQFLSPEHKYPRRLKSAGQTNGLSILVNPGIKDYFCATADFVGLEVLAHLSITTPHVVDLGSAIHPNGEVFINIAPEVINAESTIYEFDVEKRSCYFNGEFNLKYYTYYTMTNCIDECITNITFAKCDCTRYFMPRENHHHVCGLSSLDCVNKVEAQFTERYANVNCSKCLPTCNDIHYTVEIHSGPLRNDVEIWMKNETAKEDWAQLEVSIVHIFFGQDKTFPKIRKQLFGLTELVASTGGLLGLCLGFSALSLLEVLYFITIRLFFTILRRRRFADIAEVENERRHRNDLRQKIFSNVPNTLLPMMTSIPSSYHNLQQKQQFSKELTPIFYTELLVRGLIPPYRYRP